jgi:bifunctional non-homologous end joining protein LigD
MPRVRDTLTPSRRQYVAQPLPGFLELLHPKVVTEPPCGGHWLHEIKFDGYRFQARIETGGATLFTRRGHDWTDKLPELAADLSVLPDGILDGEVCFLDARGQPTFSGLRSAIGRGDTAGLVFFAFDQLWRGQDDLRRFPLSDRKAILEAYLAPVLSEHIRLVDSFPAGGPALLQAACRSGLEGIVSKRRDSRYAAGRSEAWVKSLCVRSQEFVIGGYEQEAGRHFKGVLVGVHDTKGLTYVGTLERGFSATPGLLKRLEALETKTNPFAAGGPPRAHVRWVKPELVTRADSGNGPPAARSATPASGACATTSPPARCGANARSRHRLRRTHTEPLRPGGTLANPNGLELPNPGRSHMPNRELIEPHKGDKR